MNYTDVPRIPQNKELRNINVNGDTESKAASPELLGGGSKGEGRRGREVRVVRGHCHMLDLLVADRQSKFRDNKSLSLSAPEPGMVGWVDDTSPRSEELWVARGQYWSLADD